MTMTRRLRAACNGTLALGFLVACAASAFAQGREPLTHEALWLMPRVGARRRQARTADGWCSP